MKGKLMRRGFACGLGMALAGLPLLGERSLFAESPAKKRLRRFARRTSMASWC